MILLSLILVAGSGAMKYLDYQRQPVVDSQALPGGATVVIGKQGCEE